jgi:hypothetical protein
MTAGPGAWPDVAFSWSGQQVDREANTCDTDTVELLQDGERVVFRSFRNDETAMEWPGRIEAWDAGRGLAKLRFDNTGFAFVHREGGGRRFGRQEDDFSAFPIFKPRIDPGDPAQWQLFLGYFCAALGAAEGRRIEPGSHDWQFRPLGYSPYYINFWVEGSTWTSTVAHDEAPWHTIRLEPEPGLVIRCFYRDTGGNPQLVIKTDSPGRLGEASLYLRPVGNIMSCLRIHNACAACDRITAALAGFSADNGARMA